MEFWLISRPEVATPPALAALAGANSTPAACRISMASGVEGMLAQMCIRDRSVEDLPEPEAAGKGNRMHGSILPTLNKKLISNSLNILFDLLQRLDCRELTVAVSNFLMLAVYRMFRVVYTVNHKNEQNFFHVPKHLSSPKAIAAMVEEEAAAMTLAEGLDGKKSIPTEKREQLVITSESLAQEYPQHASSLLNLIRNSEHAMHLSLIHI